MQNRLFRTFLALCVISFVAIAGLTASHLIEKSRIVDEAKARAKGQADRAVGEIDQDLRQLIGITEGIANDLSSGRLSDEDLIDRLNTEVDANPSLFGVGAAYAPYAYDPDVELYAPYLVFNPELGKYEIKLIEESYDYTKPDDLKGDRTEWYHRPATEGSGWNEPYFGTVVQTFLAEYAAPFTRTDPSTGEEVLAGVIYADFSLEQVEALLASLELEGTGYAYLLSSKGQFIAHPDETLVLSQMTIFDLADQQGDESLSQIGVAAVQGRSGVIEHDNLVTGQASWIFYEPIPSANWSLGVVFIKGEIPLATLSTQRRLIWIAMAAFVFFLSLSMLVFRGYLGTTRGVSGVAATFSVLCVVGIAFLWFLATSATSDQRDEDSPVFDTAGVAKSLATFDAHVREVHRSELIQIPTGIFIQSIDFNKSNNAVITGIIWQTYPRDTPDWVSPGFVFPEAVEEPSIVEAWRRPERAGQVIGWNFRATLRQQFDYSKYPFDREEVSVRLWPKDFGTEITLVPDLVSYNQINPNSKPGLEAQDFVVEGWTADSSFFSQRINTYNTNFGLTGYVGHHGFPELYFNVRLTRNFINPFVSNLVPIIVVACLLFAAQMITTTDSQRASLFGYSVSTMLGYCGALFFVVIITHIALRNRLAAQELIYLEYFFFVMYVAILAVSVNSIMLVAGVNKRVFHFRDNFISKVSYWPLILGTLLIVTLFVFY